MDTPQQAQTTDQTANIWDNEQLLGELIQRASAHGDPLVKVLFEASLQTLTDEQADQDYRQRVVEALSTTPEATQKTPPETPLKISQEVAQASDGDKVETKTDLETTPKTSTSVPPISPITIPTLQAPKPVSLYEKTRGVEIPLEDKPVEISRENAILHEEVRRELLRPLLAFAACVALLVALGLGWISRSGALGLPQAAYANPTKPVPAQTTNQNPSLKLVEVEQPTTLGD